MVIEERAVPIEEDPRFVVVRMVREVEDWLERLGFGERNFDYVIKVMQDVLDECQKLGIDGMEPDRRKFLERNIEWIGYCCEGAETMAAFYWIRAKKILRPMLDQERMALVDTLSPMSMDAGRGEFILSVNTAEQARDALSMCGHEVDKALAVSTGGWLNVMIWDDDLGIWTQNNTA